MFKRMSKERPEINQKIVLVRPRKIDKFHHRMFRENVDFELKTWTHMDDARAQYNQEDYENGGTWSGPDFRMWCPADGIKEVLQEAALYVAKHNHRQTMIQITGEHHD